MGAALESHRMADLEMVALDIFQIATSTVKHTWQLNTSRYLHAGGADSAGLSSTASPAESSDVGYHASSVIVNINASSASIAANRYTFKDSVWDAALFANASGLGSNGKAVLLGAIMVGAIVQLLSCLVVAHLALSSVDHLSETVEAQLLHWYTETSHDVLRSVCVHDYRARENSLHILLHEELERYSQSMFGTRMSWGPTLRVLVLFFWTLIILRVVRDLLDGVVAYVCAYKKGCKEHMATRELYLAAIPTYAMLCDIFIVVAPSPMDDDLDSRMSAHFRGGWCKAEFLARLVESGVH